MSVKIPKNYYNSYATTLNGYVTTDGLLYWGPGNPNLHWGSEGVSGMKGKRYLHYPSMYFYANEDGTVRAFGLESIPVITKNGQSYIEIIPTGNETSSWNTGNGMHVVQNYARIPIAGTLLYVPQVEKLPNLIIKPEKEKLYISETPQLRAVLQPKKLENVTYIYSPNGLLYAKRVWIDGQEGKAYITGENMDLNDYMKKYPQYTGQPGYELFSQMHNLTSQNQVDKWILSGDYTSPGNVYASLPNTIRTFTDYYYNREGEPAFWTMQQPELGVEKWGGIKNYESKEEFLQDLHLWKSYREPIEISNDTIEKDGTYLINRTRKINPQVYSEWHPKSVWSFSDGKYYYRISKLLDGYHCEQFKILNKNSDGSLNIDENPFSDMIVLDIPKEFKSVYSNKNMWETPYSPIIKTDLKDELYTKEDVDNYKRYQSNADKIYGAAERLGGYFRAYLGRD